jgi:hypothetical protein
MNLIQDSNHTPGRDSNQIQIQILTTLIGQLWCLPGEWKTNLSKILDLPLWNRIWIMQEVTSNQSVIVQCREHIVPWDFLCRVIMQSQTSDHLDVSANLRQFVSRI